MTRCSRCSDRRWCSVMVSRWAALFARRVEHNTHRELFLEHPRWTQRGLQTGATDDAKDQTTDDAKGGAKDSKRRASSFEASGFETFGFESSEQSKTLWTLLKARKVERPQSAALFQRMAPKSFTKLCEYSMSLAHRWPAGHSTLTAGAWPVLHEEPQTAGATVQCWCLIKSSECDDRFIQQLPVNGMVTERQRNSKGTATELQRNGIHWKWCQAR